MQILSKYSPCLSIVVGFILASLFSVRAADPILPPAPMKVTETYQAGYEAIDIDEIKTWIKFLSADELEGRASGEPGYDVAARFCATLMEHYGVKPFGDSGKNGRTFLQKFNLIQRERDSDKGDLTLKLGEKSVRLKMADDFVPQSGKWGSYEWEGPVVALRIAKGVKADIPKLLKEAQLEGHLPILFLENARHNLKQLGYLDPSKAKAIVVADHYFFRNKRLRTGKTPEYLESERMPNVASDVTFVSNRAGEKLLKLLGKKREELSTEKSIKAQKDLSIKVNALTHRHVFPTSNVVGIIEGSDPVLRKEYVAIGGHLDHVPNSRDGQIHNGADDNASGTAAVLSLAKAFNVLKKRPKRSIMLLLWGAEEMGLLGSGHFVEHSPVPMKQFVTYLNLDMIGRDETRPGKDRPEDNRNSVNLVGSRRFTWDLHQLISIQNKMVGLDLEDDQEDVFYRSDQYHFDRKGVPVIFFFAGFHPDYHTPRDTYEKLNYPKITRIARLCYLIGHKVANQDGRFKRDKQQAF